MTPRTAEQAARALAIAFSGAALLVGGIMLFVFWELVLVPMYFMIGIWGSGNRQYAAIKFFLYTLLGSVFMLLGFIAMYIASTPHTFDILALQRAAATAPLTRTIQLLAFGG